MHFGPPRGTFWPGGSHSEYTGGAVAGPILNTLVEGLSVIPVLDEAGTIFGTGQNSEHQERAL